MAFLIRILILMGIASGLLRGSEVPAQQDMAETTWQLPEPALPLILKGAGFQILDGNNEVLSQVNESLDDGSGQPWQSETNDNQGWRVQVKAAEGLRWERRIQSDASGVIHFIDKVSLAKDALHPVSLLNYTFAAKNGNVTWDGFSVENMRMLYFPKQYRRFAIGDMTPLGVFNSTQQQRRLHFYLPDWLDSSGTLEFFFPPFKEGAAASSILFRLQLKSQTAHVPFCTLQPGSSRQWEIKLGLFATNKSPFSLGEKDIQLYGSKSYQGTFYRRELLTMGFPLPVVPTDKPGHFFTMKPDAKAVTLIPLLAKAGAQFIVFDSPDFVDISQGVSWQDDYDKTPPLLPQLIQEAHQNGLKVLCWFSIKGVLRPSADHKVMGSPLLQQHPDWFVPYYYWDNRYQYADMNSSGWINWILNKIEHDQAQYPIDGFAFDEPYFNGSTITNGQTKVRHGYDLLQTISNKVHACSRPQVMIANYWTPQDDEWKFFDYMMVESPDFMSLQDTTMGRHAAGHTFNAEYFTFKLILNQLAFNLADFDQSIGWSAPEWYFDLHDAHKTPEQIAELLSYSGAWHRIWAAEIQPGLRQIEITQKNENMILLCNLGNTEVDNLSFHPHAFQAVSVPASGPVAWGITDTSTNHNEFEVSKAEMSDDLLVKSLPAGSITAIRFTSK